MKADMKSIHLSCIAAHQNRFGARTTQFTSNKDGDFMITTDATGETTVWAIVGAKVELIHSCIRLR